MSEKLDKACDDIIARDPRNWNDLAHAAAAVSTQLSYMLAAFVTKPELETPGTTIKYAEAQMTMQMAKLGAQLYACLENGEAPFTSTSPLDIQRKIIEAAKAGKHLFNIAGYLTTQTLPAGKF